MVQSETEDIMLEKVQQIKLHYHVVRNGNKAYFTVTKQHTRRL
uniref:Uncharacterized protein n=1 Tax=Rhizophora mucronata TaxID=61149 RepID=A0A2P2PXT0_RHIMU